MFAPEHSKIFNVNLLNLLFLETIKDMNKNIQILSSGFFLAVLTLAGCGKKDDDAKPAPVVTIDSLPGSFKHQAFFGIGTSIAIPYSVTTSQNLTKVNTSETVVPSNVNPT